MIDVLIDHIQSAQPGQVLSLSPDQLGQSLERFQDTVAYLRQLDEAGMIRLGKIRHESEDPKRPIDAVWFERLS
jgi:hypothetical protein